MKLWIYYIPIEQVSTTGRVAQGGGAVVKGTGTAAQFTGDVAQGAGKVAQVGGKGVNAVGKGIDAGGKAIGAASSGLAAVPLVGGALAIGGKGVGLAVQGVGKATAFGGKGAEIAGKGTEFAGKGLNAAGRGIEAAGGGLSKSGETVANTGDSIMAKTQAQGQGVDYSVMRGNMTSNTYDALSANKNLTPTTATNEIQEQQATVANQNNLDNTNLYNAMMQAKASNNEISEVSAGSVTTEEYNNMAKSLEGEFTFLNSGLGGQNVPVEAEVKSVNATVKTNVSPTVSSNSEAKVITKEEKSVKSSINAIVNESPVSSVVSNNKNAQVVTNTSQINNDKTENSAAAFLNPTTGAVNTMNDKKNTKNKSVSNIDYNSSVSSSTKTLFNVGNSKTPMDSLKSDPMKNVKPKE